MDGRRFDDVARTLALGASRRAVLRTLAGSAAGGVLALLGLREAGAEDEDCKRANKKCKKNSQCCSGCCGASGTCADLNTDQLNCGGCGQICSASHITTPTCSGGVCTGACDSGWSDCDGNKLTNGCETDITTIANCGACGHICPLLPNTTESCVGGICTYACNGGFADCDGVPANGCEVNTQADVNHCGGCGQVCSANHITTPTCSGGICTGACDAGWADCDGSKLTNGCETDLQTDENNCGACGNSCPDVECSTRTCTGSVCGSVPNPAADNSNCSAVPHGICCTGNCVDSFAELSCGTCGNDCGVLANCCGGVCCEEACDIDVSPQPICCFDEQVGGNEGAGTAFCCPGTQVRCGNPPSTNCVPSDQSCTANTDCTATCASHECAGGTCCPDPRVCGDAGNNTDFCCPLGTVCVNSTVCADVLGLGPRGI